MEGTQHYLDQLLFGVAPYVALVSFFLVTIQRYRAQAFTYSSLSSQFLENERHFWGMVPLHYGIIVVIAGHIVAFLFPREVLAWNGHPIRLYILEISALIFGLLTLLGLVSALIRRLANNKVRKVTTTADILLYMLLLVQVGSGVHIALNHSWGSSWFAASAAPYLWSIVMLDPDISYVLAMPFAVKLHIVNAFVVIGFFPFTRLVHILVVPNPYLWRKPQIVRWNREPERSARSR